MAGEDEFHDDNPPPPPPPLVTPTQQAPHTLSTIKLPILKKGMIDWTTEDEQDNFALMAQSNSVSTLREHLFKRKSEAFRKEFAQCTKDLLLQAGVARATSTNTVNTISTPINTVSPSNVFSAGGPKRAKLLAEYFENRKKQLAEERAATIRNKPPTKSQLRNLMMTYLKHTGRYKHAQLNKKTIEEIQVLYIKEHKEYIFCSYWSEEDEILIQKMNKKVAGVHEEKVLKEPDSTKVEVKKEGNKENTRKRVGRRLKMKATKKINAKADIIS
ncbi:hypothetical protein Tco_0648195 [Tanacetum coccineum]